MNISISSTDIAAGSSGNRPSKMSAFLSHDASKLLPPHLESAIPLFVPQSSFMTTANNRFRTSMEDTCTIVNNFMVPQSPTPGLMDTPFNAYYAVFDGHSGDYASKWCADHLYKTVAKYLDLFTPHWSFPEIMASAFDEADRQILSHGPNEKSGCTAAVAIISLSAATPLVPSRVAANVSSKGQADTAIGSNSLRPVPACESLSSSSMSSAHSASLASTDSFTPSPVSSSSFFSPMYNPPQQPHNQNAYTPPTSHIQRKTRRSYSTISPASPSFSSLSSFSSSLSTPPLQSLNSSILSRKSRLAGAQSSQNSAINSPSPLLNKYLYTCNVGDSRIVISSNGVARELSYDHRAKDEAEQDRINAMDGAFVANDRFGMPRVNGILAVSRALGDKTLKPAVSPRPYVTETLLDPEADELVILASDGLWDVCTSQEAVDIVRYIDDSSEASSALVRHALNNKSEDNITVLVIRLKKAPTETSGSSYSGKSKYSTYATDTINLTKLPTSTVSKHANTAPRPVTNSRSITPRTSSTSTTRPPSARYDSTPPNPEPVSQSLSSPVQRTGSSSSINSGHRSGTSSRSGSSGSSTTVMMGTSPADGATAATSASTVGSRAPMKITRSSRSSRSSMSSRSSRTSQRPNFVPGGPNFSNLGMQLNKMAPPFSPVSPAGFGVGVLHEEEEEGRYGSAIDDDDDDIVLDRASGSAVDDDDDEEGLFRADDITGTGVETISHIMKQINEPNSMSPIIGPVDHMTSSTDTITGLRPRRSGNTAKPLASPTSPTNNQRAARRTSFVGSPPPGFLGSSPTNGSSSVPTRSVKTRVGILEIPIGSPNRVSTSPSNVNARMQSIMSGMPGGASPSGPSPRAVYREKLRSQSFSPGSLHNAGGTFPSNTYTGESRSSILGSSLQGIQEGELLPDQFGTSYGTVSSIASSSYGLYGSYGRPEVLMSQSYNQHKETMSTSLSSSQNQTLDRYGRFKRIIDVEFGDLDDECAIADDDDDDDE